MYGIMANEPTSAGDKIHGEINRVRNILVFYS